MFSGYLNDPEATAAAYLEGGWYRTGDVVRVDPERYVWVLDRARDMVIAGGENIFPAEVEAVLAEHPDVREAAVIGLPDQRWGEVVHAVVVPDHDPHADGPDLIAWTRERLAHFKCPRSISFVEVLPRTTTGKVLKRELRLQMTNPAEQPAG
jgi:acyl-CoA synthetase (AMP-forming)/AMP-acid ligase II